MLCLLVTNALGLAVPWILGRAVSRIEAGAPPAEIRAHALAILALSVGVALFRVGSRLCFLGNARRAQIALTRDVFGALLRKSSDYFDRMRVGDLMSRVAHDVRSIRALMGPGLLYSCNIVFLYTMALSLLMSIDWQLTLLIFLPFPLLVLGISQTSKSIRRHSLLAQEKLADVTSLAHETLAGSFVVRGFAAHERGSRRFDDAARAYRDSNLAVARARGLMTPLMQLGTGLGTLVILYAGGQRVISGELTLGQFVAFIAYLAMLVWPTYAMGWVINILQRTRPALGRVCEVLNAQPSVADAPDAIALTEIEGALVVRDLTWRYGLGEQGVVLDGLTFEVAAGERVALMGRVGSGKSTLLALLSRLYPTPDGAIFLDGHDINQIQLADLRRAVAQAPQEALLFSRPIDENIAFGEPTAAQADVETVAGRVRIDEEIRGFSQGYQTWVGERGVTLSGGQRQRMTLARSLLVEPPVLTLDDATASVDAGAEQQILDELFALRAGKTTIMVTHRTRTARLCDRILMLDRGRLEAIGTHDELLRSSETYRRMVEQEELRAALGELR